MSANSHDLGLQPSAEELIGMKVQGVNTELRKGNAGHRTETQYRRIDWDEGAGVTPEYVKSMQAAGFKDLDCDELIGAKVQGVNAGVHLKTRGSMGFRI